jgi:hypothetical protein
MPSKKRFAASIPRGLPHSTRLRSAIWPKMAATVENAKALLALEREHGSIRSWLDSFSHYADAANDVGKRFKYLSKTFGAYYFLYIAGAKFRDFPSFEEWSAQTGEEHPRMRELVTANEGREVQPFRRRRSSRKV